MQRVYVLGAGSIGTLFAHHIAAAGVPCTLLLRSQAHLAALHNLDNHITVDEHTVDGTCTSRQQRVAAEVATLPHSAVNTESRTGSSGSHQGELPIQHLILTTKANHAIPALAAVKHRLSSDSVIVLLQNGVLGVYVQAMQELFPQVDSRPAFLLGSTTHGAYRRAAFHVVHGSSGQGSCVFGLPSEELQASAQQAAAAGAALTYHNSSVSNGNNSGLSHQQQQGCESRITKQQQQQQQQQQQVAQDMLSLLSSLHALHPTTQLSPQQLHHQLLLKLLVNCCANPLSALLHCKNGGLIDSSHAASIWRRIISECKQVFGDMLPEGQEELFRKVHHVVKINSTNYNSMLQDVVRKCSTEVDYLNGFVASQGAVKKVPTPVNEMLAMLVKAREDVPHSYLTKEAL